MLCSLDSHGAEYLAKSESGLVGQYGGNEVKEPDIEMFDENAEKKITEVFGDKNAKVVVIK